LDLVVLSDPTMQQTARTATSGLLKKKAKEVISDATGIPHFTVEMTESSLGRTQMLCVRTRAISRHFASAVYAPPRVLFATALCHPTRVVVHVAHSCVADPSQLLSLSLLKSKRSAFDVRAVHVSRLLSADGIALQLPIHAALQSSFPFMLRCTPAAYSCCIAWTQPVFHANACAQPSFLADVKAHRPQCFVPS
jgi:hypothetical protein